MKPLLIIIGLLFFGLGVMAFSRVGPCRRLGHAGQNKQAAHAVDRRGESQAGQARKTVVPIVTPPCNTYKKSAKQRFAGACAGNQKTGLTHWQQKKIRRMY